MHNIHRSQTAVAFDVRVPNLQIFEMGSPNDATLYHFKVTIRPEEDG